MPKKEIDYSNTIIYKIVCKDIAIKECYVGSTTDFTKRKCSHKNSCINPQKNSYNVFVYDFIRKNGGWDNWDMVEIEKYNAIDKLDQHKRERYYIELLEAKLNKQLPSRTTKENEESRKNNPVRREYIKQYTRQYWKENQETLCIKNKLYREEHKEEIAQKRQEKVLCDCGCEVSRRHLARHNKSEKHNHLVNS